MKTDKEIDITLFKYRGGLFTTKQAKEVLVEIIQQAKQEGIGMLIKMMEEMKIPKQERLDEMRAKTERLRQVYERNKDSAEALEAVRYDENSQATNVAWGRTEGYITAMDELIAELKKKESLNG